MLDYSRNQHMPVQENLNLPVFLYGVFTPREIASHIFSKLNLNYTYATIRNFTLKTLEGIPVLVNSKYDETGFVAKCDNMEEVYKLLATFYPGVLFKWSTGTAIFKNNEEAKVNVLVADKTTAESSDNYWPDWKSSKDYFFSDGMDYLEKKYFWRLARVSNASHKNISKEDISVYINKAYIYSMQGENEWDKINKINKLDMFELQTGYVFLWTIIDRFCTMRYSFGGGEGKKLEKLRQDVIFKEAVEIFGNRFFNRNTTVGSSQDGHTMRFNPDNCLRFYYQVRNNSVHRGKILPQDKKFLRDCFIELYAIMKYVITKATSGKGDDSLINYIKEYRDDFRNDRDVEIIKIGADARKILYYNR